MKTRLFLALLVIGLLLFGCVQASSETKENKEIITQQTNEKLKKDSDSDTIVITQTTNQSVTREPIVIETPQVTLDAIRNYSNTPDEQFAIYFIYVGDLTHHGDAILIKRGDFDMLIDGGPKESGTRTVDFLKARAVDDLEVVVSTHADPEHYGGLDAVLDEYHVGQFWFSENLGDNPEYQRLIAKAQAKTEVIAPTRGGQYSFNSLNFTVLNPRSENRFANIDNDALAFEMTSGDFCILLLSDLNVGAQSDIINEFHPACDLVQMPWHGLGQGNSNANLFIGSLNPKHVILSGGPTDDPNHGGSRLPLFQRLNISRIPWTTNYEEGSIRIVSDGTDYEISHIE